MGDAAPARYAGRLRSYLGVLGPMYEAVRHVSGANVIVDSTKDAAYAHAMRRMAGVDLRVLHLVRDSRGVAWSWAKLVRSDPDHYMRQFSPPVTASRWVAYNLMVESKARLGPHHTVTGNPMRMTAGSIDIRLDEAWRTHMPFRQRAEVTALTWPLLRRYSHAASSPSASAENTPTALDGTGGR